MDISSKALSCCLVALFAWLAIGQASADGAQHVLMLGSVYMVWEYASQAGSVISAIASHFQTFARQQADYASADAIRQAYTAGAHAPTATDGRFSTTSARGGWHRCDIRELTYRHSGGRTVAPTLDHIALSLERGKRYALIGGSGSGKSTLLRVLAGLYEAERIVLDQSARPTIVSPLEAARSLRGMTTLIPQDAEVFEATLAENLALCESLHGPPAAESYPRALELARVADFIEPNEVGLNAAVAERAANWSGGQRARVALARGILAAEGSSIVLLDEPTASLDPKTEAAVYDNLFIAFADACIVSSLHRLHLVERFDEVLVMHDGRLVAQGPPTLLAAVSPDFRQLIAAYRREAGDESPAAAVA